MMKFDCGKVLVVICLTLDQLGCFVRIIRLAV